MQQRPKRPGWPKRRGSPWNVTCESDRLSLVYFGKQQRQDDDNDPADVGQLVNPVPAFGDPLVGLQGRREPQDVAALDVRSGRRFRLQSR